MLAPTRLLLLRHGEVEESYHHVFGGRIDMNLSSRGHEQARALARWVSRRPVDAIYVSPMRRAQQTLVPLASHCPTPPIIKPELREVDFGDWTGLTWEEVRGRYQISAFHWLQHIESGSIPNAENGPAFRSRVEPCLHQILREHSGQTVAVLCHGGVIRVVLSILLDLPLRNMSAFEIDYASLTAVEHHTHKSEITLLNFAPWRDLP